MANQFNLGLKLHVLAMYKECLHNHGVGVEALVLDGCGQFEPSGPNGTVCDACNCHRNFHRRVEVDLPIPPVHQNDDEVVVLAPHRPTFGTTNLPQQPQVQVLAPVPPMQDLNQPRGHMPTGFVPTYVRPQATEAGPSEHKKRLREEAGPGEHKKRLREEKSEKLGAVAESNNWKAFSEYSKDEVAAICSEFGIEKEMFKAWLTHHKNGQAAKQ